MTCRAMMDQVYDALGEKPLPLLFRARLWVHCFFCARCAAELENLEALWHIRGETFFPEPPHAEDAFEDSFEDSFVEKIMEQIYAEDDAFTDPDLERDYAPGVSFRSWVITGCIILLSLSTVFFGFDFIKIAAASGSSFLVPVGLTVGCFVTGYGAVFIGSHLKELSHWFRLHD